MVISFIVSIVPPCQRRGWKYERRREPQRELTKRCSLGKSAIVKWHKREDIKNCSCQEYLDTAHDFFCLFRKSSSSGDFWGGEYVQL
jgi:hypothetical protein